MFPTHRQDPRPHHILGLHREELEFWSIAGESTKIKERTQKMEGNGILQIEFLFLGAWFPVSGFQVLLPVLLASIPDLLLSAHTISVVAGNLYSAPKRYVNESS
jgi:hypothetical protein